jgi:hypothetical protein
MNALKSSPAICHGNAVLKTDVSEIFSVSIIRVHTADRPKEFSLLHVVQIGCGAHPASYPLGTGGKAAGA